MEKPVRFDLRLPPKAHKKLVKVAQQEHRSIHAQILLYIEKSLENEPLLKK